MSSPLAMSGWNKTTAVVVLSVAVAASLALLFCRARNDHFEFCTTEAYGWPFPWRIEYCLCEKARIVHPAHFWAANIAIFLVAGAIIATVLKALTDRLRLSKGYPAPHSARGGSHVSR